MSTILGIETAVGDGSVAIVKDGRVLSSMTGVSRAETLIPGIKSVLETADLRSLEIDKIAVSCGPGSFTGIRVGLATVKGLKRAIGLECVSVSLFAAIAGSVPGGTVTVVIAVGREHFGIQEFECMETKARPLSEPFSVSQTKLFHFLEMRGSQRILFCGAENDVIQLVRSSNVQVVDANLAVLVAMQSARPDFTEALKPIYLGK